MTIGDIRKAIDGLPDEMLVLPLVYPFYPLEGIDMDTDTMYVSVVDIFPGGGYLNLKLQLDGDNADSMTTTNPATIDNETA